MKNNSEKSNAESLDPLDLFMADLSNQTEKSNKRKRGQRLDFLQEDEETLQSIPNSMSISKLDLKINKNAEDYNSDEEVYAAAKAVDKLEQNKSAKRVVFDSEGNPVLNTKASKTVEDLPPIDHSKINYDSFVKDVYKEHPEIKERSPHDNSKILKSKEIRVTGRRPPKFCDQFSHFNLSPSITKLLQSKFKTPSSIQSMAVPAILQGRDLLAIAKTGSGKTLAFMLPLIEKLATIPQHNSEFSPAPRGIVITPTHELSKQIYQEALSYAKANRISIFALYGGMNAYAQGMALKKGVDILIGTPVFVYSFCYFIYNTIELNLLFQKGRLVGLIRKKVLDCRRVIALVLDEADRMLQMGFQRQVKSILKQIRPDRQMMMFSATFPREIQNLAESALREQVQIVDGKIGAANMNVRQVVEVFENENSKFLFLLGEIERLATLGSVIVFVSTIRTCEELPHKLRSTGIQCGMIHGDFDQRKREDILVKFSRDQFRVLIATDVAARGLHINGLKTVISFEAPRNLETHINRVGRTGRAGERGVAYTLLTQKDQKQAKFIRANLVQSKQTINPKLDQLASACKMSSDPNSSRIAFTGRNTSKTFGKSTRYFSGMGGIKQAKASFEHRFVKSSESKNGKQ